jgi:molybdopterin biosynthesis enzyme
MAEPFGPEGLQLAEARALILDALVPLGNAEHVAVHQALGRVAA